MSELALRLDTAQIGPLRRLLEQLSPLQSLAADLVRFRVVVDANSVVQNLLYRVRYPERGPTALEEMVKATVIEVFAPRWLDREMASAIPQAAAKSSVSESLLWVRWLEFRALLKWDESLPHPGEDSLGCCDPKDYPYVMLEQKLGADGILSKDHHIAQMGGHLLTLDFVLSARSYARAAVISVNLRVLGVLVPTIALMAVVELLRRTARAFAALPSEVRAVVLIGASIALLHPGCRGWIASRCGTAWAVRKPLRADLAHLLGTLGSTGQAAQSEALVHLLKASEATRLRRLRSTGLSGVSADAGPGLLATHSAID